MNKKFISISILYKLSAKRAMQNRIVAKDCQGESAGAKPLILSPREIGDISYLVLCERVPVMWRLKTWRSGENPPGPFDADFPNLQVVAGCQTQESTSPISPSVVGVFGVIKFHRQFVNQPLFR